MDTIIGNSTKPKYRKIGKRRSVLGQKKNYPTNKLKNNDYNDLLTKQRTLNSQGKRHRRRKTFPKNTSNNIDYHEFGNDYIDTQNKNRNLSGQKRKHGTGFGRKKHSKNQSINNDWQTKHGQERKRGRGLGQRTTYSKNRLINSDREHRRSFGKREKYPKNDYNEFGDDYTTQGGGYIENCLTLNILQSYYCP